MSYAALKSIDVSPASIPSILALSMAADIINIASVVLWDFLKPN